MKFRLHAHRRAAGILALLSAMLLAGLWPVQRGQAQQENPAGPEPSAAGEEQAAEALAGRYRIALPMAYSYYSSSPYRINAPRFVGDVPSSESAVIWFGAVTPTTNYTDVRVGYNDQELYIHAAIVDRHLWYQKEPRAADFSRWDNFSVFLKTDTSVGGYSYRLDAQLSPGEPQIDRGRFQAAYRSTSSGWKPVDLSFRTKAGWKGRSLNSEDGKELGWIVYYHIPFKSLGLSGPPEKGSQWRIAFQVHDRDDAGGQQPIPVQSWPPDVQPALTQSWAYLRFGLPGFVKPPAPPAGSTVIQDGLNGQRVQDNALGGSTTCGKLTDPKGAGYILDFWKEWGSYTFTHPQYSEYNGYLNVQNESEIADFPCFSKVYLSFPLETVPEGKQILKATLALRQFGNSGGGEWGAAPPSLIQVFTLDSSWDEDRLSWNNAPLPRENVSQARVPWLDSYPGWPGVERQWDVSATVAQAYISGQPLQIALYSADEALHSGKYFYSSEQDGQAKPRLEIVWGNR